MACNLMLLSVWIVEGKSSLATVVVNRDLLSLGKSVEEAKYRWPFVDQV